jgi:hypothetical protein
MPYTTIPVIFILHRVYNYTYGTKRSFHNTSFTFIKNNININYCLNEGFLKRAPPKLGHEDLCPVELTWKGLYYLYKNKPLIGKDIVIPNSDLTV